MRKSKLVVSYELGAKVIGLVTTLKEYKLAWNINQVFKIDLIMQPPLLIEFIKGSDLSITNYLFKTELQYYRLIRNKGNEDNSGHLIPELVNFDFFLMIGGEELMIDESETKNLNSIKGIDYFQVIDVEKLKAKDNFIF
ncbi:MAG: IPExxxVDY family protein [Bacteroidetes bacterium]|nr:MAG: IPExxxVDY family protein [Bacteroidota bacterium]